MMLLYNDSNKSSPPRFAAGAGAELDGGGAGAGVDDGFEDAAGAQRRGGASVAFADAARAALGDSSTSPAGFAAAAVAAVNGGSGGARAAGDNKGEEDCRGDDEARPSWPSACVSQPLPCCRCCCCCCGDGGGCSVSRRGGRPLPNTSRAIAANMSCDALSALCRNPPSAPSRRALPLALLCVVPFRCSGTGWGGAAPVNGPKDVSGVEALEKAARPGTANDG